MKEGNTSARFNYCRKAPGRELSTLILSSTWECLSFRSDKRPKRVTPSTKPWWVVFRSPSHPRQGMPWRICRGNDPHPCAAFLPPQNPSTPINPHHAFSRLSLELASPTLSSLAEPSGTLTF